jgi:hypothetical protein
MGLSKKNSAPAESKLARKEGGYVLVPRVWLIGVPLLLLFPWLMAGLYAWLLVGSRHEGAAALPAAETGEHAKTVSLGKVGSWGQLEYLPIVIAPPLEFIPDAQGPMQEKRIWFFQAAAPEEVAQFLLQAGLSPMQVSRLMSTALPVPEIQGVGLVPPDDLILGLAPSSRAAIYSRLAESPHNHPQRNAFRFFGISLDEWVGRSRLPKEVTALVEPLVYRRGDFMYFADIDLVTPRISDQALRRRLNKALFRESTLLVQLRIPRYGDIDRIADYWGTGGRRMDIRPLLESLGDHTADITHLLPVFARRRMYTYRPVSLGDFDKPQMINCFWTALNFFNDPPDDRFLDFRTVLAAIKRDYYLVHDNFQLGDLVLWADKDETYYHAAVYIADDLVFTKNGDSILSPFVLVPLERIQNYYLGYKNSGIYYYRLKRFS